MRKTIFGALLLFAALTLLAVNVDPARAVIVVNKKADGTVQFAAQELQKYLKMITGTEIAIASAPEEGKYPFFFGTPEGVKLKPEEACWEVTKEYTRLYGDSTPTGSPKIDLKQILSTSSRTGTKTKTGDLTAVYDFLEKQLGVLFLAPGEHGVSYEPARTLELKEGKNSWTPVLAYRGLWPDRNLKSIPSYYKADGSLKEHPETKVPAEFLPRTRAEFVKKDLATRLWLKQQRMGEHGEKLNFGHAFTRWWEKYGESHPEYFALVDGKRQPKNASQPDRVKLCVSNPAVWKQIAADWAANPNRTRFINVCENDSKNYCECPECRKLDMPPRPGAKWDDDLSDRYVYFANHVLEEARKIDPNAKACHYAYSVYRHPPRREKLDPGIYIGLVASGSDLEDLCKGWYEAGARKIFLRPNALHITTPLPMGCEQSLFDPLKTAVRCGIIGTSYDSLHGFWDISGLGDYVLARCHVDPSKDLDHWITEYCSAWGPAAAEARAYFDYYRTEIWEKRILPNRKKIAEAGRYGNFRRGLMWNLGTYYKETDFDELEKILRKGLEKDLSAQQKYRLETLLLVNEHSRLTCRAMSAKGEAKIKAAVKLLQFRRGYKDRLNINWERLFNMEITFGDCTGVNAAQMLKDFSDIRQLPISWFFCLDPENVGETEKWHELSGPGFRQKAKQRKIQTNAPWEKQKVIKDEELRKTLANYDGVAWYSRDLVIPPEWKEKDIFLVFGGVDESARVYVNGKFAGSHDDWQTPFSIPVTEMIDWTREKQTVTIRVEDKAGQGGIWRPILLAARDKTQVPAQDPESMKTDRPQKKGKDEGSSGTAEGKTPEK